MNVSTEETKTPMMVQWHACKEAAGDALLFFRLGDFYEAFHDDAVIISRELEVTLTKRQETPMAGVPCHTCEGYIDKLVAKGYRVAIAEQTEDAKVAKGIVKREVVRIVTPGSVINSSLLSDHHNNFVASISRVGSIFGLSFIDITTAEYKTIEFDSESALANEVYRLKPAEILVSPTFRQKHATLLQDMKLSYDFLITEKEDWIFAHQNAHDFLLEHFKTHSLDGFGLRGMVAGINAAGSLLRYLKDTLSLPTAHLQELQTYTTSQYMSLDRQTQRNLELTESLHDGGKRNTVLSVLDATETPMGARLLRHWIKQPLQDIPEIQKRLDAVEVFYSHGSLQERMGQMLSQIRDLERLMMKMSSGYASPRDLSSLKNSLTPLPSIKAVLGQLPSTPLLQQLQDKIQPMPHLVELISKAIVEDPPARVSDGNFIRAGFHHELDQLRAMSHDSKSWMMGYQNSIKESTGIKTLKVGYNKMSGYYIEVSKGQCDKMPDSFQRRQTLANAERYITPELKEYENKVLNAEERISGIETELFHQLRLEVSKFYKEVHETAQALARVDCLQSLGHAARVNHYVKPQLHQGDVLEISEGRHPIIEAAAKVGERFIPNDTFIGSAAERLFLITGPNMAGKSTYIRQVALITILGHIGSFVPAKAALIPMTDKVFTRIGASDDLSRGQSTFMVEMAETANILNNATDRSLVILDEIGRGTSTYDGISIAWSVAEYLLTTEGRAAKTLFATHYWELTKLEEKVPGAINYHVAVNELEDDVIFLRKIVKGGTDKSYGIHVARLAGLPSPVLQRAKEILVHLEENANRKSAFEPSKPKKTRVKTPVVSQELQLTFFE